MARIELADSEVHDLVEAITEIIGDKGREFDSLNRPRYEALLDRLAAFESAQKADRRTGLDLDRFRARARDLRKLSSQLSQLASLPDRVTKKDFEDVSKLMVRGADDLEALLEARLPGCLCRLIENDNYSYLDGESARALVRVYSPDRGHPYEGMIICRDHLRQIFTGSEPPFVLEELPADRTAFWNHRCLMCGVNPVHDRQCASDRCRRPLHPQWPAVYCKNMCALEDL